MPTAVTMLGFCVATLVILVVPGPSVMYVVARSIAQGRRAGLYSMLGLEVGALLHVAGAAVGLGALLASSELAFTMLRYAGAAYLFYLGVRQFRVRHERLDKPAQPTSSASLLRLFRDGVLVDLLNPKTALFFVAFLPQFVDVGQGAAAIQVVVLGLCFVFLAALCDTAYALVAGQLGARIRNSHRAQRRIDQASAGVYICLAGAAVLL
ncbi:MAG TPA: RhtB family transporter [Microbacterium sp.]|uniref:LysE family translocator n=1 Tax=Microbacterium sp. TaxID=51671 RepID=UPI000EBBBA50|nr:RhtB family transporter [Microbacterium sp.]